MDLLWFKFLLKALYDGALTHFFYLKLPWLFFSCNIQKLSLIFHQRFCINTVFSNIKKKTKEWE